MNNYTFSSKISKIKQYDVVIVGGGVAGCASAAIAARKGLKTLLIEQEGTLGGQAGPGIVTPLSSTHSSDNINFGGILKEITDQTTTLAIKYCIPNKERIGEALCAPHILKYVLLNLIIDSGAEIMFHTTLTDVVRNDRKLESIIAFTKSGYWKIDAKYFIDASGDGDLVALSNEEFVVGSEPNVFNYLKETGMDTIHSEQNDMANYKTYDTNGKLQPVSIFFTMGGVDYEKAQNFNNQTIHYLTLGISKEEFEKLPYAGSCGFEENGEKLPLPQGRILISRGVRDDVAVINMSRVIGINGIESESLNDGEIKAQKQVLYLVDFLKRFVPGFNHSYFLESASTLGIRETRRLVGRYVLSGKDVILCRKFDDAIARGSYMIDIHDPNGKTKP